MATWSGYTGGTSQGDAARRASYAQTARNRYNASRGNVIPTAHARRMAASRGYSYNPSMTTNYSGNDYTVRPNLPPAAGTIGAVAARQPNNSAVSAVGNVPQQFPQQQAVNPVQQQAFDYIKEMQGSYDQARAANESRYADIIGRYDSMRDQNLGYIDGIGEQRGRDIDEQFDRLGARQQQDLVSRGLNNTTIKQTTERGVADERSQAQNRLAVDLNRERMGVNTDATMGRLGVMERRDDNYPDPNQMIQLLTALGASGQIGYGGAPSLVDGSYQQGGQPLPVPQPVTGAKPLSRAVPALGVPRTQSGQMIQNLNMFG